MTKLSESIGKGARLPYLLGLALVALPALAACARDEDGVRAEYRTAGGEEREVELEVDDDDPDFGERREDVIEDEIIEDADGPFE